MPTFDDIILRIEVERDQATKRKNRAIAEIKAILSKAEHEGRAKLTEEEEADVSSAFTRRTNAEKDLAGIESKLKTARAGKEAEDQADAEAAETRDQLPGRQLPAYDQVARIGQEERTYRPDRDKKGAQFLRDVSRDFVFRDPQAGARLARHMQEERVERAGYLERAAGDTNTGNWAGLTVPQYLTDMYAPAVAGNRPFANVCNPHDLPQTGMTVNISRVTTASSVAKQSTEISAVSATSLDDTLLTENVLTAAGQQNLSRQAIDRAVGVEEVAMGDLFKRYATNLDSQLLNDATTGLSAVAQAQTLTTGSPTAALVYSKLLGALSGVEGALLGQASPSHIIMAPRRWYWFNAQTSSTWPFLTQPGAGYNQFGATAEGTGVQYNQGARGVLPMGLPVIVDANIAVNFGTATSEDEIYVVPRDECHLWEDPNAPVFIRAEQPNAANLAVLIVLYGYFAYSFRRYTNGMGKVGGTGLTTPSF